VVRISECLGDATKGERMPWETRAGEPTVTDRLVRSLLAAQHPDLAGLPIGDTTRGWDNTVVRLGGHLALRLPRHPAAEGLLDREVLWLPRLAARLRERSSPAGYAATGSARDVSLGAVPPLVQPALPTPVRTGVPGPGFPYRWAIVPWVDGTPAVRLAASRRDAYAPALAAVLDALHQPAPDEAPASGFRGVDLATVEERFTRRWRELVDQLTPDRRSLLAARWAGALAATPHPGPRLWLHGDPHPNNTVVAEACASGNGSGTPSGGQTGIPSAAGGTPVLVDYGDLCAGDPASDLGAALLHFSPAGARAFREAYDARRIPAWRPSVPDREALWARARGWSVYLALVVAAQSSGEALRPLGRAYLEGRTAG
jgi:aminoglycoside phosphotransferase (APT) family kinase protein